MAVKSLVLRLRLCWDIWPPVADGLKCLSWRESPPHQLKAGRLGLWCLPPCRGRSCRLAGVSAPWVASGLLLLRFPPPLYPGPSRSGWVALTVWTSHQGPARAPARINQTNQLFSSFSCNHYNFYLFFFTPYSACRNSSTNESCAIKIRPDGIICQQRHWAVVSGSSQIRLCIHGHSQKYGYLIFAH